MCDDRRLSVDGGLGVFLDTSVRRKKIQLLMKLDVKYFARHREVSEKVDYESGLGREKPVVC